MCVFVSEFLQANNTRTINSSNGGIQSALETGGDGGAASGGQASPIRSQMTVQQQKHTYVKSHAQPLMQCPSDV